jgi:hypothetical protein
MKNISLYACKPEAANKNNDKKTPGLPRIIAIPVYRKT